jgi:hypothetical protein
MWGTPQHRSKEFIVFFFVLETAKESLRNSENKQKE